jgi:hypothetical protein
MANVLTAGISFIIVFIISTVLIYIITKLFGEKEGIEKAFVTAIFGAIIYGIAYFLAGNGLLAAIAGAMVWLLALKALYRVGWLEALIIGVIIWISAAIFGILLPTVPRPL